MEADSTQSTETYLKLLAWLHANRKALMIGAGVVVVIAAVAGFMAWQKSRTESEANAQFMKVPLVTMRDGKPAPSPAGPFLDLAKQYPETSAGEYAALLGGETLFIDGKFPEAHQNFSKFIDQYPESRLLAQAKLGVAASMEGEGKVTEAMQKYQELLSAYAGDANIVSPARLTLARLDEQMNKPEQALAYYSDLARNLNNNPYDLWAAEARERGELLLAKHPELRKQPARPPGAATGPTGLMPGGSQSAPIQLVPPSQPGRVPAPTPAPATKP